MKWSRALLVKTSLLIFLFIQAAVIQVAVGAPDEAVGRVVSVISGDSLGIEIIISDPRTNNVDSIKLADIISPSTVTPEGKAAKKYANSLLKNKTVYIDIDDSTASGRNEWSQLICVVYLMDSEYRPVWPPVNRIIVDAGYAKLDDDKENEFDPSIWWQEPAIPEGSKGNLLKTILEKRTASGGNIAVINATKSSVMQKDSESGLVSIGYRA
jgi:endonuclease YncB( thermonuclease family)